MSSEKYLEELQSKYEEVSNQVAEAQQQLNGLIDLKTKIEGAIEHKNYEMEKEKEAEKAESKEEKKGKK